MSDLTIKVCDVCDRHKGESNHWFSFYMNEELRAYVVTPLDTKLKLSVDKDLKWDKKDICSIDCLNKAENRIREGEKLR